MRVNSSEWLEKQFDSDSLTPMAKAAKSPLVMMMKLFAIALPPLLIQWQLECSGKIPLSGQKFKQKGAKREIAALEFH